MFETIFQRGNEKAALAELAAARQAEAAAHTDWENATRANLDQPSEASLRLVADKQAVFEMAKKRRAAAEAERQRVGESEAEKARIVAQKKYEAALPKIDSGARLEVMRKVARELRDHLEAVGPILMKLQAVDEETQALRTEVQALAQAAGEDPRSFGRHMPLMRTALHEVANELRLRRAGWPVEWKQYFDKMAALGNAITE